jgi:hypothetical protein
MAKRKIFWVPVIVAILGAVVAVTARSSRAEAAVDDCLSKPNAPPPQGSHWYYRSDRASNRRCWYLGPQGEKVSQAASPRQRLAAKPAPQPTVEPPVEAIVGANEPMPAVPVPWLGLPTSIAAVERKPALPSDSDADEPSETRPREDMPLIWPVLTAADLDAAEASTVKADHMLALAAAALALAIMIVRKIFKLFTVRRLRRRRSALRAQWDGAARASGVRAPVAPAFAATPAAARPVGGVHNRPAAPRLVELARQPARRRNPYHDFDDHPIEDPEIEESLRRLLHDWRRAAA